MMTNNRLHGMLLAVVVLCVSSLMPKQPAKLEDLSSDEAKPCPRKPESAKTRSMFPGRYEIGCVGVLRCSCVPAEFKVGELFPPTFSQQNQHHGKLAQNTVGFEKTKLDITCESASHEKQE